MKKLFESFQKQTLLYVLVFSLVDLLPGAVGSLFTTAFGRGAGLWSAIVTIVVMFIVTVTVAFVCLWWVLAEWEVPRPWAMYAVSIASTYAAAMSIVWMIALVSGTVNEMLYVTLVKLRFFVFLGALSALAWDRFLVRRGIPRR